MEYVVELLKDGKLRVRDISHPWKMSHVLSYGASDRVIGSVLYVTDLMRLEKGEKILVSGIAAQELELYIN